MNFRSITLALSLCGVAGLAHAQEVIIKVNAGQKISGELPRTHFGTFLEPIGRSIYGGLWAEILANPSFEENLWTVQAIDEMVATEPALKQASKFGLPLPWQPLDAQEQKRYEPRWGDAANSWRSLAIFGVPEKPTGIRQKIYLPVHREWNYSGSIYAKHLSGPGRLKISIRERNNPANVLAETAIDAGASQWQKYPFQLQLKQGAMKALEPADFVIELDGDERVQIDEASLMPDDAVDGMDPDEIRLSRDMKTPLLRFGGNYTSAYHWKDGVGDRDKRVNTLNIAWGMPEYNTFGTDELLRFCELIGAQPQIALNLGSGTAEEAGEWVRYVNEHWGNKRGGLIWELGNELWNKDNLAYPTLQELPKRTLAFSRAVKAVDPAAKLIATGEDPDHFEQWNAAQLQNPPGTFQFLSTHFVVTTNDAVTANPTEDGLAGAAFALPVELGRRVEAIQKQIDGAQKAGERAHVAFTEWLFHCCRPGTMRAPSFSNMGGAIEAAGVLNMLLTHAEAVPISDMTGLQEFSGIWKKREQVYGTPSYYAFQLYSTADIDHLVAADNDAGTYQVKEGIRRLPEIQHVPYLDVVAAVNKDGSKLTLFCVNRHLTQDMKSKIAMNGFSPAGAVHIKTLSANSIYDENNEESPERIVPKDASATVSGGQLEYTFPHESITRIEMGKQ